MSSRTNKDSVNATTTTSSTAGGGGGGGGAEKRLRRLRSKCPAGVQQRIDRARTQRLYLIQRGEIFRDNSASDNNDNQLDCDFVVLGSTGNIYTVTMGKQPKCSCPDHAKGNLCKHILFVWIKVLCVPPDSPLIYQHALLSTELRPVYKSFQERCNNRRTSPTAAGVMAKASVRRAYQELTSPAKRGNDEDHEDDDSTRRQVIEGDCPICFDELLPSTQPGGSNKNNKTEALVFCRGTCGANFHADCMNKWKQQQRQARSSRATTCPNCRCEWIEQDGAGQQGNAQSAEGYQNLGHLQGQRGTRDTSTYSDWYGGSTRGGRSSRGNKRHRR